MCEGVEIKVISGDPKNVKAYFSDPGSALPVVLEDGTDLGWVAWGRRSDQSGRSPEGGWIDERELKHNCSDVPRYQPAIGLVDRYMAYDIDRAPHWFYVGPGRSLKCVVVTEDFEQRVYLVTTRPPAEYFWIRDRWPTFAHQPGNPDEQR
ncbi:Uncharacterised protein [Pseudomonas fluorescens]|uniref:Uncharacterized protein n=1 Tax=Pseudomonas fluorescens TaxID=294 RepID=A0A3S4PHF7_PSEFL|nr:Uncharacterised protein [Pseudomonas fluorescens]